jgi:hypothetical protein
MASNPTAHKRIEKLEGASRVLVGGGVVTMGLFPLALPMILLLVIAGTRQSANPDPAYPEVIDRPTRAG